MGNESNESTTDTEDVDRISVYRHAIDDSTRYIDNQIQASHRRKNDLGKALRMNLFIMGLIFTAFSSLSTELVNNFIDSILFILGSLFILLSVLSILIAFSLSKHMPMGGLKPKHISMIFQEEFSEEEFLEKLLKGHRSWIANNTNAGISEHWFLMFSYYSLALGIFLYLSGLILVIR